MRKETPAGENRGKEPKKKKLQIRKNYLYIQGSIGNAPFPLDPLDIIPESHQ